MLSLGPLSGMPLSSVPLWERLRAIIVRCSPVAEYQPYKIKSKHVSTEITAYASRVDGPAAFLVSSGGNIASASIVGNGPAAFSSPEQISVDVVRGLDCPTAQLGTRYASDCQRIGLNAQNQPRRIVASVYRVRHRVVRHKC